MPQHQYRGAPLERRLSIEETYSLANVARRKSSSEASRQHLRQRIGHAQMLEALENVIRNSPPPSPQQSSLHPVKSDRHITWAQLDGPKAPSRPEFDEYGFAYDDEDDEDGLSLTRTQSRQP